MIRQNFLKEKLKAGKPVIGTWNILPSIMAVDIIASTGIDFIIVDNEHGTVGFENALSLISACESRGVSPVYRPPGVYEPDILKALDLGFHAIQVPNITIAEQLKSVLHYSKFPPIGNRGFSPFIRAAGYTHLNSGLHTSTANENVLTAINIEGTDAVNNIDAFLEVEGLDIIFIGAFDLSKALGIPGQVEDPKINELLKSLTVKIRNAGKHAGTISTSNDKMKYFLDIGIDYIVHLVDCEMLRASYNESVNLFRKNTI
jgi:4-hydroxy-2-oxoheptanedioate aldolase